MTSSRSNWPGALPFRQKLSRWFHKNHRDNGDLPSPVGQFFQNLKNSLKIEIFMTIPTRNAVKMAILMAVKNLCEN